MEKMFLFLALAVVILVAVAIAAKKLKPQQDEDEKGVTYPYKKKESLFTAAERSFLGALDSAIGDQFRIFGKVRLQDIADVNGASSQGERTSARNRINKKHIDFVLCEKDTLSIVCGIELNDKSHNKQSRQDRDDFLERLCSTISLPLVTIPAQRAYSISNVRTAILNGINQNQIEEPPALRKIKG